MYNKFEVMNIEIGNYNKYNKFLFFFFKKILKHSNDRNISKELQKNSNQSQKPSSQKFEKCLYGFVMLISGTYLADGCKILLQN